MVADESVVVSGHFGCLHRRPSLLLGDGEYEKVIGETKNREAGPKVSDPFRSPATSRLDSVLSASDSARAGDGT